MACRVLAGQWIAHVGKVSDVFWHHRPRYIITAGYASPLIASAQHHHVACRLTDANIVVDDVAIGAYGSYCDTD